MFDSICETKIMYSYLKCTNNIYIVNPAYTYCSLGTCKPDVKYPVFRVYVVHHSFSTIPQLLQTVYQRDIGVLYNDCSALRDINSSVEKL